MGAGPFIWKQAPLASQAKVELTDTAITVSTKNVSQTIQLKDITNVYYYRVYLKPYRHRLHVQIETSPGDSIRFGAAGFGPPNSVHAQECRKAAIAFFSHLERTIPDAQIYEGVKPTRLMKWMFVAIFGFLLAFGTIQVLRESSTHDLTTTLIGVGIAATLISFSIWRTLRKLSRPKSIPAKSAREALELFDQEV